MDVLNKSRRRGWPWIAIALSVWLGAAACLSLPTRRSEPSFPHRVHVVDNALACSFCHAGARAADHPGMPPPELCAPCHDKIDPNKPVERRVAAFFAADSRYRTVADTARPADVAFSHRSHVTAAKLDCITCHQDINEQDDVPLAALVKKVDCMQCHAEHGKSNACAECHRIIDETWAPRSHQSSWLLGHGQVVRCGSERSEDQCSLCHREAASGCSGCHQQMAPADHDSTFRTRTHGLQAMLDRTRCATCHRQDSCQQCHEATRPRSHRGSFGSPQDTHCVSCHLPLADSGCAVCHRGTPSHDRATPLPPGHSAGMNCRLCHGNGQPLPHPDGGHSCTSCHR